MPQKSRERTEKVIKMLVIDYELCSYIIRSLINVSMKLDINVEGIKTEKDLKKGLLRGV